MSRARGLAAALAASVLTNRIRAALTEDAPGGQAVWQRTNHRGEPVSLLEGPSVAAGVLGGLAAGGEGRAALGAAIATSSAAAFGIVDDLAEDAEHRTKGLRGHLGALARGELTTGGLKVLGIGATSLVAAAVALGSDRRRSASALGHLVDVGVAGALIAGTANLVNLLDLRPGRAAKASVIAAAPALLHPAAAPVAAGAIGAAAAGLPGDLAERDMLGDGGANALGALVGTAAVLAAPRPVRAALLAGVVGLTVASERVSFTQVIARTPVLREIDAWGRRPAPGPTPAP